MNEGILDRVRFNHRRNVLQKNILETNQKFVDIKRLATEIYNIVEGQRRLLRSNMTGSEEADLRHLLEVESEKSKEFIKELNGCIYFVTRSIESIAIFQIRLLKFLKKSIIQRGRNLVEDSEAVCNRIEEYISTFYAFKSYIQLVGLVTGFLCPIKEIQMIGFAVAGGAFALDWIMDWIAGLPETRRIANKFISKIRKIVDEEELRKQQLTRTILANSGIN